MPRRKADPAALEARIGHAFANRDLLGHALTHMSADGGAYAKSYDCYGTPVTEGVTEIAWTAGDLPDDWYDEFVFRARLTDFPAGAVVYFPIVQECADGAVHRWIESRSPASRPTTMRSRRLA